MKVWNRQETVEALREIAAANPDHIDPNAAAGNTCKYVVDGAPCCIVGVFLVDKVGLDIETVARLDTAAPAEGGVAAGHFDTFAPYASEHLTRGAIFALDSVQTAQDAGCTWSGAVEELPD